MLVEWSGVHLQYGLNFIDFASQLSRLYEPRPELELEVWAYGDLYEREASTLLSCTRILRHFQLYSSDYFSFERDMIQQ